MSLLQNQTVQKYNLKRTINRKNKLWSGLIWLGIWTNGGLVQRKGTGILGSIERGKILELTAINL